MLSASPGETAGRWKPSGRPHGVYVHTDGTLYVADSYNHRILAVE